MKFKLFLLAIVVLLLSGCADYVTFEQAATMEAVGFWHGLWHGMTCGITFLGYLFLDDTTIYAIYNTGGWYDFGFCLGVGAFISSSSRTIHR